MPALERMAHGNALAAALSARDEHVVAGLRDLRAEGDRAHGAILPGRAVRLRQIGRRVERQTGGIRLQAQSIDTERLNRHAPLPLGAPVRRLPGPLIAPTL